jgi:hypothetical protein
MSDDIIIEICHQIFNFNYLLTRLKQICQKLIKRDQTWSNWISDEIIIEMYHQIFEFIYIFLDQNGSDLSKKDQDGSSLIKFNFWWNNHWNISSDFQLFFWSDLIRSVQDGWKWIKLDQIRFLMKWSFKCNIRFSILFIFWSDWIRSVQNLQFLSILSLSVFLVFNQFSNIW